MWFWNRKELYCGNSMKDFSDRRDILAANGIKYDYKIIDMTSSSLVGSDRARLGSFGINSDYIKQYYLYVHKKDLENAKFFIHNSSHNR